MVWFRRTRTVVALAGISGALAAGALVGTIAAPASATEMRPASSTNGTAENPYLPSAGHSYRHGAFPSHGQFTLIHQWAASHGVGNAATATSVGPDTMLYLGGLTGGQAVVSGTPKVYLVFWGNQWGAQGADGQGNITLSNDYDGGAPYIQKLFKGLGTSGELWSGTMTQYCDGTLLSLNATSCPSGAAHVGYPTGGALAGVWYDNGSSAPQAATQDQLTAEAQAAALHFGNTTAVSNRYVQYDVLSAPGTNPDSYQSQGFCAWHTWAESPYGNLAYTNMPYVMDVGASCGMGAVNNPGTLDGYSIVNGHEYAETLTDEYPNYGWLSTSFEEVGDECAWISSGPGAMRDVTTSTGAFAMQSVWSNDTNSCALSHVVVTGSSGSNTVTVTSPGATSGTVRTATSLQISASDSASGQTLTYSASGLPSGLSVNTTSGLVSGTPTAAGTFSVTLGAKDGTGALGSAAFTWTIAAPSCSGQLLVNPGFESGQTGWTSSPNVVTNDPTIAHGGSFLASLDGDTSPHTDVLSQTVSVPSKCKVTLTYWLRIYSASSGSAIHDTLTVSVNGATVQSLSHMNATTDYVQHSIDLSAYAGKSVMIQWKGTQTSNTITGYFLDDTALTLG